MAMWNPWRGCRKCSDGCLHCYIHKGDAKRGVDTSRIVKTADFGKPAARLSPIIVRGPLTINGYWIFASSASVRMLISSSVSWAPILSKTEKNIN